jgi:hypothetical protein
MDPITATRLVEDRTQDLRRLADQVRQERSLRSPSTVAAAEATPPAPAQITEARRAPAAAPAPANAGGCDLAEPAA